MPFLDVDDILDDEDFADTFSVTRNGTATGTNGRTIITPTVFSCVSGVVYPLKPRNVQRGDMLEYVTGAIKICTQFRLTSSKTGRTADIVKWNGNDYAVMDMQDWSRFGAGYIEATCELLPVIPA